MTDHRPPLPHDPPQPGPPPRPRPRYSRPILHRLRPSDQRRATGRRPPPVLPRRHCHPHPPLLLLPSSLPDRRPRPRPLLARPGVRPGRRRRRHGLPRPGPPRPDQRLDGRPLRGRRRGAAVDRRPPRDAEARPRPPVVDRLPPPHGRRHALQRRRQRAGVPPWPADRKRVRAGRGGGGDGGGGGGGDDVLAGGERGALPRGAGRAGTARGDHPGADRGGAGTAEGPVVAAHLHRVRGAHEGPGAPGVPDGGRRRGLRLRGGFSADRPLAHLQLAVVVLQGGGCREDKVPSGGVRGGLLLGGGSVLRPPRRRRRRGNLCGSESGGAAGAAPLRAGLRLRERRLLPGVPRPRPRRRDEAPGGRAVGRPPPVAQPLRSEVPDRRLRGRRLQEHHPQGQQFHGPRPRLPHEQEQVGREDVGGVPGRGGILLGGAAEIPRRRRDHGQRRRGRRLLQRCCSAGGAERGNTEVLQGARDGGEAVLAALHDGGGLEEALRPEVGEAGGVEEEIRPQGDPVAGPTDLLSLLPALLRIISSCMIRFHIRICMSVAFVHPLRVIELAV